MQRIHVGNKHISSVSVLHTNLLVKVALVLRLLLLLQAWAAALWPCPDQPGASSCSQNFTILRKTC
jgi:hypothetical protein